MDDNTFDCPKCGAKIYPEMARCPECGQNMYPEDEDTSPAAADNSQSGWVNGFGAVVLGWMIAGGIALLVHFIVASFVTTAKLGIFGKAVLLLAGPGGAIVGGFVALGISRRYPKSVGALVGVLTLPILALYATHWVEVTLNFLLNPWILATGVLTILAGAMGGWLHSKFSQDTSWKEKWQVRGWEDLLYQDLLRKVRFNGSAADRLIEYEHRQDPQASRLKLIQNAIERWERDNR